jgi:hypothetical protein
VHLAVTVGAESNPAQFINVALNLAKQIRRASSPADFVVSLLIWATGPQSLF